MNIDCVPARLPAPAAAAPLPGGAASPAGPGAAPRRAWRRLAASLLALPLAACAVDGAADQRDFGATVRLALAQQLINPGAAANRDPVTGLDGRSARSAIDNYDKSYAVPAQPVNVFKIGVGDGK